ncbi:hypothetical protein [Burkholderia gladioli]|uniref:hypothetical protein n=1 Tax=Burkholderia gladioli TaxID=28095 RepID=UPI001641C349|nr:hypothetical protein [Burkholderia gladioli]
MGLKTWGVKAATALRSDAGALVGERQHRETIGHIRGGARQIFTPAPRSEWSKLCDPPNRAAFAAKYHAVGLSEADLAARHASFARSAWVSAVAFIFLSTLLACIVVQSGAASLPLVFSSLLHRVDRRRALVPLRPVVVPAPTSVPRWRGDLLALAERMDPSRLDAGGVGDRRGRPVDGRR